MSEVVNTSGLEPLGCAVLCKPWEPKRQKSVIALPDAVLANERNLDTMVQVIAVGPVAWPNEPPRAQAGDIVFIARLSGVAVQRAPGDEQAYRFVNDRDIFAKVTSEVPRE